jgi:septal ring factor EnvC (AmiA/AmiB activator)
MAEEPFMTDTERQQLESIIKSQELEIEQLENRLDATKPVIEGLKEKVRELLAIPRENRQ